MRASDRTETGHAPTTPGGARSLVTHALGLHTLVMYGITYYAIGATAPVMAREFGVTTSTVFVVLGVALVAHAMVAASAGRAIDRLGAGLFLLAGSIMRVLALVVMAFAADVLVFVTALAVIQFMSVFTEYDAAFAAAVEAHGDNARGSLSLITVWGGLASTAFWPLTTYLLDGVGWRTMFLMYAGIMAAVSIPVSLYVLQRSRRGGARPSSVGTIPPGTAPGFKTATPDTAAVFLPLVLAFSLGSVAMGIPIVLPNLLDGLGLGSTAVLAGLLFGPSQTAGRFFEFLFARRLTPLAVAIGATALLPLSIALLVAGRDQVWAVILFAVLFGAGNGISYVVRGTVVLSLFGPSGYATYLGRIARIRLLVAAATPVVLTYLLDHYGAVAAFTFAGVCGVLAVAAFEVVRRLGQGERRHG
ncbi:MAG TPA: MFS transporter [Hyphomicrobiaceae bacterium]|nr:MFS transporter [Hyphomicrobiaceae bacterium]